MNTITPQFTPHQWCQQFNTRKPHNITTKPTNDTITFYDVPIIVPFVYDHSFTRYTLDIIKQNLGKQHEINPNLELFHTCILTVIRKNKNNTITLYLELESNNAYLFPVNIIVAIIDNTINNLTIETVKTIESLTV